VDVQSKADSIDQGQEEDCLLKDGAAASGYETL
jgi:hypothetical protein